MRPRIGAYERRVAASDVPVSNLRDEAEGEERPEEEEEDFSVMRAEAPSLAFSLVIGVGLDMLTAVASVLVRVRDWKGPVTGKESWREWRV